MTTFSLAAGQQETGGVCQTEALYPFGEFAVRTAKSVLALLSVIGRISVATRRFVRSYRFSYTEVAEGSAGQVPGA